MTIKVTITADDREITVETSRRDVPVAAVVADALTAWTKTKPTRPRPKPPTLHAGGIGFCAELGPEAR